MTAGHAISESWWLCRWWFFDGQGDSELHANQTMQILLEDRPPNWRCLISYQFVWQRLQMNGRLLHPLYELMFIS